MHARPLCASIASTAFVASLGIVAPSPLAIAQPQEPPPLDTAPAMNDWALEGIGPRGGTGSFGPVFNWGLPGRLMVPIHAALVPDFDPVTRRIVGKIFSFGYYGSPSAYLWDPRDGSFELSRQPYPIEIGRQCGEMEMHADGVFFCSGHSVLPDGRVLLTGGDVHASDLECSGGYAFAGPRFSWIFDPRASADNAFIRQPDMNDGRWYPTNLTLQDGRVVVMSGYDECSSCANNGAPISTVNRDVEVFTPSGASGSWQIAGQRELPLYPNLWLHADNQFFYAGPGSDSAMFTISPSGQICWFLIDHSNHPFRGGGSFVGVPGFPGRIMLVGGGCCGPNSTNMVEIIDLYAFPREWRVVAPLALGREYADATILPDQTILVSGGRRNTWDDPRGEPAYLAELYDPHDPDGSPEWRPMASAARPRMYHSTALLLPDGSVWTAGGTGEGPHPDQPNAEIFYPPYWFAARPTIVKAPKRVQYSESFSVFVDDASAITAVSLIRPGSTTHAVNMEQRLVPCDFVLGGGTQELIVTAPDGGASAPPGFYMLFVGNADRVPSQARFVRVAATGCPGDLDVDGDVELSDLAILLSDFGCSGDDCVGDVDEMGGGGAISDTDLSDLATLLTAFGGTCE